MKQKYFTKNKRPLKAHKNIVVVNAIEKTDWDQFMFACDRVVKLWSDDQFITKINKIEKQVGELVVAFKTPKTEVQSIAPRVLTPTQNGR